MDSLLFLNPDLLRLQQITVVFFKSEKRYSEELTKAGVGAASEPQAGEPRAEVKGTWPPVQQYDRNGQLEDRTWRGY